MKIFNLNIKNKEGEKVGSYEGPRFQVLVQEPTLSIATCQRVKAMIEFQKFKHLNLIR